MLYKVYWEILYRIFKNENSIGLCSINILYKDSI